jgi:hypothetical protein
VLFEEAAPTGHRYSIPPSPQQRRGGVCAERRNLLQVCERIETRWRIGLHGACETW